MKEFSIIDQFVKKEMCTTTDMGHAYDHVRRVFSLVLDLGEKLGANLRILGAAALLHDVGRLREKETGVSHSILSGEMSREILNKISYSNEEIEHVVQTIRTHRFSEGLVPTSLEGEILSDVDKLDAMGAIGVYRAIAHAVFTGGGVEAFLQHVDAKLLKLKDLMYTNLAKSLAKEKHERLLAFISQLREELIYTDFDESRSSR